MNRISLKKITVEKNRIDFFFEVEGEVRKYFSDQHHLFFEYNCDVSSLPKSILTIPFAANVAPLAWLTDSILTVHELDWSFYESLPRIKNAYQRMFPHYPFKGTVMVQDTRENSYTPEREAGSLFSGGLDAVTTFIRVQEKKPVLITEYGWHNNEIVQSEVWEADKANAISFAKQYELDNILIQSNYGTFLKAGTIDRDFSKKLGDTWWHGLHHGLAIITAAIPAACTMKIKQIYIASSNSPEYPYPCASDPTVDNEIRFASGQVRHDAYELTRQDKVKVLTNYFKETQIPTCVRVCFKNEQNCCRCEKCMRTIMGIIAEGHDPCNYGFDVPKDLAGHMKTSLNNEVKFFTDPFIAMYWTKLQQRMLENKTKILYPELVEWFLDYDFVAERKKSLLKYRVTNFFPILKRKVRNAFAQQA